MFKVQLQIDTCNFQKARPRFTVGVCSQIDALPLCDSQMACECCAFLKFTPCSIGTRNYIKYFVTQYIALLLKIQPLSNIYLAQYFISIFLMPLYSPKLRNENIIEICTDTTRKTILKCIQSDTEFDSDAKRKGFLFQLMNVIDESLYSNRKQNSKCKSKNTIWQAY